MDFVFLSVFVIVLVIVLVIVCVIVFVLSYVPMYLLFFVPFLLSVQLPRVKQTTLIIHPPTVKQLDAAESWSPVCLIFPMYFSIKINIH